MIRKVLNFIRQNKILEYGDSVILGVSGGADSICMLYVLKELEETLNLTLHVVHVNHHIRGEEARWDADYVKTVCDTLDVPYILKNVDVPRLVRETGMSEEEAGRQARYEIFYTVAKQQEAGKIAVAHNFNDNSETILFHLFRGSGIRGMTGIPVRRDMIVRPLLCCTRTEIEEYLRERNISYCTDTTNMEAEYSRNKIRLELMPYIQKNMNQKAEYHIVNAAENLAEVSDFLEQETKKAYDIYVKENVFQKEGFALHPALKHQIVRSMIEKQTGSLKDITRTHILSVVSLMDMEVSKSVNLPGHLVAERIYEGIILKEKQQECTQSFPAQVLMRDGRMYPNDLVEMEIIGAEESQKIRKNREFYIQNIEELVYTKWIDCDKIQGLTLRNRRAGDYLVIDDKGSRKKLKNYFIDEKIPRERRDKILLLADGSHIVWIIGYRLSAYYKITEKTSHIMKLTYKGTIQKHTQDKE